MIKQDQKTYDILLVRHAGIYHNWGAGFSGWKAPAWDLELNGFHIMSSVIHDIRGVSPAKIHDTIRGIVPRW